MAIGELLPELTWQSIDGVRSVLHPLQWSDVIDIIIVAFILYGVYRLIQETRALRILYGLMVLAFVYVVSRAFNLLALKFLLESAFTIIVVAIPIVFQPELRGALERIGRGELMQSFWASLRTSASSVVQDLVQAARILSEKRIGALIVLERQTGLRDFATQGVTLDAVCTPETLVTIFTPNSPLHDGAVILRGDRITAASVFLPLTDETEDISLGTRHRAALGISRETDAVVLVVSEETGRIALVVAGKLIPTSIELLERRLRRQLNMREQS